MRWDKIFFSRLKIIWNLAQFEQNIQEKLITKCEIILILGVKKIMYAVSDAQCSSHFDQHIVFNIFFLSIFHIEAFGVAMEHVQNLEKYRKVYLEEMPPESDFQKATPEEFQAYINKCLKLLSIFCKPSFPFFIFFRYNDQMDLFNNMPDSATVGILQVDSSNLKKDWLPIPRQRLQEIQVNDLRTFFSCPDIKVFDNRRHTVKFAGREGGIFQLDFVC